MTSKTFLLTTAACVLLAAQATAQEPSAQELDAMTAEELLPIALEEGSVTVYAFTSRIVFWAWTLSSMPPCARSRRPLSLAAALTALVAS